MSPLNPEVNTVRGLLTGATVAFGIPAFNEGDGVLPTFVSLWEGLVQLGLTDSQLILSDSSDAEALSSSEHASRWARSVGARLEVDSANKRRSLKEALNTIFQ